MKKELEIITSQKRDQFIKENIITDQHLDMISHNILPIETLMSHFLLSLIAFLIYASRVTI